MKVEQFIRAFGELSPEEQDRVRSQIGPEQAAPSSCCSEDMMQHMKQMMGKIEKSKDPMAMCREMMRMCQEKMSTAGSGCA